MVCEDRLRDPIIIGRHTGIDAVAQLPCAAFAKGNDANQDRTIGAAQDERATAIALAGIDAAITVACAHHAGLD